MLTVIAEQEKNVLLLQKNEEGRKDVGLRVKQQRPTVAEFFAHTQNGCVKNVYKLRHLLHVNKNYLKLKSLVDKDMLIQKCTPMRKKQNKKHLDVSHIINYWREAEH